METINEVYERYEVYEWYELYEPFRLTGWPLSGFGFGAPFCGLSIADNPPNVRHG